MTHINPIPADTAGSHSDIALPTSVRPFSHSLNHRISRKHEMTTRKRNSVHSHTGEKSPTNVCLTDVLFSPICYNGAILEVVYRKSNNFLALMLGEERRGEEMVLIFFAR